MIVDDSARMRQTLRRMLGGGGVEICECVDGAEAAGLYAVERPDWVLMDIRMPIVNGLAAARQIRELDPQARILIVTELSGEDIEEAAADAGAVGLVNKEHLVDGDELNLLRARIVADTPRQPAADNSNQPKL